MIHQRRRHLLWIFCALILCDSSTSTEGFSALSPHQSTSRLKKEYWIESSNLSTSGKSEIQRAYRRSPKTGKTYGDPIIIKTSKNVQAIVQELKNYKRLSECSRDAKRLFVKIFDQIVPGKDEKEAADATASIVMELGEYDLYEYLHTHGAMEGFDLRVVLYRIVQCAQVVASANLVWTEIKSENFVVCPGGKLKGIDLESAVPLGSNPIEFTAKSCPPELALGFTGHAPAYTAIESSFDVWSIGTLFYEMSTGELFHDKQDIDGVAEIYRRITQEGLEEFLAGKITDNPGLLDLLSGCLRLDRRQRYTLEELLNHPYITGLDLEEVPDPLEEATAAYRQDIHDKVNYDRAHP